MELFSNDYTVEKQVRVYANLGPRPHSFNIQEYEKYDTELDMESFFSLILGKHVSLSSKEGPDYPELTYSVFYNDNPTEQYYSKALEYHIGGDGRYYVMIVSSSWNRETWEPEESLFFIELEFNTYATYANTNYEVKYYQLWSKGAEIFSNDISSNNYI